MTIAERIEGDTYRLLMPLLEDDELFDVTGWTVNSLIINAKDGTLVDTTADFGFVGLTDSTVYYDPDAADFTAAKSPYRVRIKVTDSDGKVRFYPSTVRATIRVRPV